MPEPLQSIFPMTFAFGALAGGVGLPAFLTYMRVRRSALFPRQGNWIAPGDGSVVLVAFLAMLIVPSLVQLGLNSAGFFQWLYGQDFPQELTRGPQKASHVRGLWGQTFAAPVLFFLIAVGVKVATGASWGQIGLSGRRLPQNFVLGYLTWLIVSPVAFVVFYLALALVAPVADTHPLMDLGEWFGPREAIAFAIQAVVLMPAVEELVFRGILLPWTVAAESKADVLLPPAARSHLVYALAVMLSVQSSSLAAALNEHNWNLLPRAIGTAAFLLLIFPAYLILPLSAKWRRRLRVPTPEAFRAIFGNGALFAAVHAGVWPTPIPLFILGAALAWLALRTRGIFAPFIVHAMFNGVAVIYQQLGG